MPRSRKYRLGVAVDMVVFTVVEGRLEVLLSLRPADPYAEHWALPGGFVGQEESADEAAMRELSQKAGVEGLYLEQLYTFTDPLRDPRSRVVSVAYFALVSADRLPERGGSRRSRWFVIRTNKEGKIALDEDVALAFDHEQILQTAIDRIRGKLEYVPIGFQLLPHHFTLTDLQQVYQAILGHPIDKRNFRAKLLKSGLVRERDDFRTGAHRPARLYEFTHRTF